MKTPRQSTPAAHFSSSLFHVRQARGVAALLLVLAWLAGCGGDSDTDGGGPGPSTGEDGIRTLHDGVALNAGVAVQSVNTFWFDEGQKLITTVVASWAAEGDFGVITARLTIRGKMGEQVQAGSYRLIADADAHDAEEMSATLNLEHGVASLPRLQRSVSGTLEIKQLETEGNKLNRLVLEFDGGFADDGDDPLPGENPISGSIRYTR